MKRTIIIALLAAVILPFSAAAETRERSAEYLDSLAAVFRAGQHKCEKLGLQARLAADEETRIGKLHYETYSRLSRAKLGTEAEAEHDIYREHSRRANDLYSQSMRAYQLAHRYEDKAVEYANRARLIRIHGGNVNSVFYGMYETPQHHRF